ncbi:MAG TPA: response regulator, partial [Burkholderiaceae bacterium]|nr:response regulator [Burkholderiaceae bacterium]
TDAVLRRDRDGRAVEIVGVAAEIDELRQLRTQVEIERADRDLAAAAGIASWQWDPADGRVHWSAQQCALMRVDPQRFDGSLDALLQRLAPEHRAPFRDALQRARETGTLDVVACWQLDDGGRRWTRSIGRLTAAADSAPPRLRVIDVDVSAQHEARDELAQMQSQQQARLQQLQSERESLVAAETARREAAEQANRAKDEFLSLVSHELRTPLNAMVGWLHVLEQSGSFGPDAVARATTGLNRAVHQQRELVDTLLEAARAIRGELKLRKSPVDLNALVARCVEAEQPAAQQRRQGLVARLHAARPWIEADAERLERVLRTLLAAAIKYGSEASQIRLAVESGAAMTVAVRIDERPAGAAASNLAQVFRAFDERQGGRLRAERQLALPFALAGQIVELHGGRIRLIDPGSGQPAALELALERVPPPPSETLAQDEPIDAIAFDGLSLLVVDDQSEMRDVLTTLLGQRGAHVTAVGSAREAMALYAVPKAGGRFDAAILDIAMPEEDGLSLLSRMREWEAQQQASGAEWPRLPALALTAHASSTLRDHALASGFDRFLAKPVAPVELFRTVAELIDRKPEPRARSPAGAGGSAPQPD